MLIWKYHYVLNTGLYRKNNTKHVWNPAVCLVTEDIIRWTWGSLYWLLIICCALMAFPLAETRRTSTVYSKAQLERTYFFKKAIFFNWHNEIILIK